MPRRASTKFLDAGKAWRAHLDEYRKAQTVFTKAYSDLVASVDFGNSEIIANEFEFVEGLADSKFFL